MENKTIGMLHRIISFLLIFSMVITMIPYLPVNAETDSGIGIYNNVLTGSSDVYTDYKITLYQRTETPVYGDPDTPDIPTSYTYSYAEYRDSNNNPLPQDYLMTDSRGSIVYLNSDGTITLHQDRGVNFLDSPSFKQFLIDNNIGRVVIDLQNTETINNTPVKILEQYSVTNTGNGSDGEYDSTATGDPANEANIPSTREIYKINYTENPDTNEKYIDNESSYKFQEFKTTPLVDFDVSVKWRDTNTHRPPSGEVTFDISRTTDTVENPTYTPYTDYVGPSYTQVDSNNDTYTYGVPERDKNDTPYRYKAEENLPASGYDTYQIEALSDNSFQNYVLTTFECEFLWRDDAHSSEITKDSINAEFIKSHFELLDETDSSNISDILSTLDDSNISYDAETGKLTISGLVKITADGLAKVYSLKPKKPDGAAANALASIQVDDVKSNAYTGSADDEYLLYSINEGVNSNIVGKTYNGGKLTLTLTGKTEFKGPLSWSDEDNREKRENAVTHSEAGDFVLYRYVERQSGSISQVGTWTIANETDDEGNPIYIYRDNGNSKIDKYDNNGQKYVYFAKERINSDLGEYGVTYDNFPAGTNYVPFDDSYFEGNGIYNGSAVFPNGASVHNGLVGFIEYGVDSKWIAAALQGGTGELHYKLQRFNKDSKQWEFVSVNKKDENGHDVLDENGNPIPIDNAVDLLNFSAELMEKDDLFQAIRKYDDDGNLNHYRVVQTMADRTDEGHSGSYDTPVAMAYDTTTGELITETQSDGRVLVKLLDPNNNNAEVDKVRVTIGQNDFEIQAFFDEETNTFYYEYRLVGEIKVVMNKDWSPVPATQIENVWNSTVTLKLLKFNYTTGEYEYYNPSTDTANSNHSLTYTTGEVDEHGDLKQFTTNGGTFTVKRTTFVEGVTGISKPKYAVEIVDAPMYDAEGHINKYSIVEAGVEPNVDSGAIYSKADGTETATGKSVDIFTAYNTFGDGGEWIDFKKVWMDDGEEEYKTPVGVYMSARAMPLPIQSNHGDTVGDIESDSYTSPSSIPITNNTAKWIYIAPWSNNHIFPDWNTNNDLGYMYFGADTYTDENTGTTTTLRKNVNTYTLGNNAIGTYYVNIPTIDGGTTPLQISDFTATPALSDEDLAKVNADLTNSGGYMMDTHEVMNEDNIWTARVEVRIGYSYNHHYDLRDFREYLDDPKIKVHNFYPKESENGAITDTSTKEWISIIPKEKIDALTNIQKVENDGQSNVIDLAGGADYGENNPVSFDWFSGIYEAGYDMDNNGAVDYYRYYAVQEQPNPENPSSTNDYKLSEVTFTNTRIGIVNYRVHFDWKVGSRRPDMEKVSIRIKADYHDGSQPQYITVNGQDEIEIPLITDTEGNYVDDYYITNLPKYTKTGKIITYTVEEVKVNDTPFDGEGKCILGDDELSVDIQDDPYIVNSASNSNDLNPIVITNYFSGTTDVTVNKIWKDDKNALNTRTDLYIKLFRYDTNDKKEQQIGKDYLWTKQSHDTDNHWSYTYSGLDKYDAGGYLYDYYVTENNDVLVTHDYVTSYSNISHLTAVAGSNSYTSNDSIFTIPSTAITNGTFTATISGLAQKADDGKSYIYKVTDRAGENITGVTCTPATQSDGTVTVTASGLASDTPLVFKLQRKAGNDTEFSAVPDYYDDSKTPFYHNVTDRVYNNGTITNKLVGTTKIHVKKLWDSINKTLLKYNDYPIADIFLYANIKSNRSNYKLSDSVYARGKDFDHGGYAIIEGASDTSEALGELVNMNQINVSEADVTAGKTEFYFTTVKHVQKDDSGNIQYTGGNTDHVLFGDETTLPKYDDNGALINYSIKERAINGYTYRISGDEIINEYVGGDRVQIKVTKNWRNMTDASQYPTVKLTLHQCYISKDGTTMYEYQAFTETIRATDSTPVTYIFGTDDKKPLHKYAPTGKEFFYYVSEELIDALGHGKKVFSHYDVDPVTKVVTANNNSELSGLGFVCTITNVSDDSFKPNASGIITVPVSEVKNGTLTLNVNNLPSGTYTVSELTSSGTESSENILCDKTTTATLTVTKTISADTPENIYFKIYENTNPNTPISVPNSGDFIQIESTGMIVIPKADVVNGLVLTLNDMYSGSYTVEEFDVEGNPVQSDIAISKTDTVSLTITKTMPELAENEIAPTNIQFKILDSNNNAVKQTADGQTLTAFKPDAENEIPVHERADVENNYSPSKENFQSLITINKNWQRYDGDNQNPLNKEFEGISNYSFDLKRHTKTIAEKSIFRVDTGTNENGTPAIVLEGIKDNVFSITPANPTFVGKKANGEPAVSDSDINYYECSVTLTKTVYENPITVTVRVYKADKKVEIRGLAIYGQDAMLYYYTVDEVEMKVFNPNPKTQSHQIEPTYVGDILQGGKATFTLKNELKYSHLRLNKIFGAEFKDGTGATCYESIDVEDYSLYFNDAFINRLEFTLERKKTNEAETAWQNYMYLSVDSGSQTITDNNNGTATITAPLSKYPSGDKKEGQYYYEFKYLPMQATDGTAYQYRVIEHDTSVGDYVKIFYPDDFSENPAKDAPLVDSTSKYFQNDDPKEIQSNGGTDDTYVRNIFQGKQIEVEKIWNDGNNTDGMRPEILPFTLHEHFGNNASADVSLSKELKNEHSWKRTFLLPRYYYNGEVPIGNILFYVSENLDTARRYGNSGDTLTKIGYKQEEVGYVFNDSTGNHTGSYTYNEKTYSPNDFSSSSSLSGTESNTLVGMYLKNKKEVVNSKLTFEKQWEDDNNPDRPKEIYIKTLRRTKGTVQANKKGQFVIDASKIDKTHEAIIEGLPLTDNNNRAYTYFFEPELSFSTKIVGDTATLVINSSGINSGTYVLKRRSAVYVPQTYSPEDGIFTIPSGDALSDKFSLKLKNLDISDGSTNYTYQIVRDLVVSISNGTVTANSLNGETFKFKVQSVNNNVYSDKTGLTAEISYQSNSDKVITIPAIRAVNGKFSVIIRNLDIAPDNTSPDYRYRIVDSSGNPISDATIVTTGTNNGKKDILITKNGTSDFSFKLQRSSDGTNYSDVSGLTAYVQYSDVDGVFTIPAEYDNNNNFLFKLKNVSGDVQIVSLSAVDTKTENTSESKKDIIVTADSNGSGFQFKVQRSANGSDFEDITNSVTAERYFEDEMPYICPVDGEGFYTVPSAYKFGDVYSLKIKDFTGDFKLIKENNDEISYQKQIVGSDTIFTVSNITDNLKFKMQTSPDSGTTYTDVIDAKIGAYSEEIVKTAENGTSLRMEYFPATIENEVVKTDHYGNTIGYEDFEHSAEYPENEIPYGTAFEFDGKYCVLVKGLDKLPEGQSYSVSDTDATVEVRQSGIDKVDLLVTRNKAGAPSSFAITGGGISGNVTAVRFFKADSNGVVKLPASVAKSLSEHLDYGVSADATNHNNGLWEKYYYSVVECNEYGNDNFSSLTYSQSLDDSSNNIYTAKKIEFDINTSVYHQNESTTRKYINIKIVDGSGNIVKQDINGNPLKLTMTFNGQTQDFYASDEEGNIPEKGVIVIPTPVDCASVHCVVDNLPYGFRNDANNGWETEYTYNVKRCKATGKDGNYDEFTVTKSVDDSQPQKPTVTFTYKKSWDESAKDYRLQPDSAHFVLYRTYEGCQHDDYVQKIDNNGGTITGLASGIWVNNNGVYVWKPYSYYLKEYNSAYDVNNTPPSKEISANNMYSYEYIYETDKPFILKDYTYAELNQGVKNKLRKTKHELIKVWNDEDEANRADYTIKLQTKAPDKTEWEDVDLSKIKVYSVSVKSDGTKQFTKQTVGTGDKELKIPFRSLHYSFDDLPLFDSKGLEYSYRVVETKIGSDGVKEEQTYLFIVPGTESTDEEYSYCRSIRRGTKTYYVDYSEKPKTEYIDKDGIIHEGEGEGIVENYSETTIKNEMVTNIVSSNNFKATKIWNDKDNVYGKRPETITFTLKRTKTLNGETSEDKLFKSEKTVSAIDNWECEWKQCAAFAADGGEFNYYIEENTVDYYTIVETDNTQSDTKVYTFTNTYKPQMKKFTAYKNWDDISNQFNLRPNEIKYELWCKYAVYELSVVKDENNKIVSAEPRFVKTVDIPVYDTTKSQDKDQSHVYRFMKSQDNTLNGSTYFKKTLTSTDKDGDNTNRWKVEFDNLPDYINTCIFDENNTDGKYVGKASQVTYYIKETVDDKTKQIYECADSDDSMKSAEKKLQLYGQNDISSKVNAGTTNGNIEVPKTYSSNGLLAVLISDLPANDIYDKKYTYSVKEVLANGTESNGTGLKCEESGFHDNSNGKTSLIISKELQNVCFKIQREISENTTKETVVKDSAGNRLSVTINDVTYTADSNGVICVPKVYTGTATDSKIVDVTISNLPASDESSHAYTYSVVECDELGEAAVSTTSTMTVSLSGTTLTVTKPLDTESANVTFRLYRTPENGTQEGPLKNITYEKNIQAEVGANPPSKAATDGKITVSKSYAVNDVLTAKINGLPTGTYSIIEYDGNNPVAEADRTLILEQTDSTDGNTQILTVKKEYPKLYFKIFRRVEDGNEEPVTTIQTNSETNPVKAFCKGEKSEPDGNGVMSFSYLLADNQTLTIYIPNLPEKNSSDQAYIYVVKEWNPTTQTLGNDLTISEQYIDGGIVYLTVKKNNIPECEDMYFQVLRDDVVVKKIETGTKDLTASKFTVSKTEPEGEFLKATGDNDTSITNTMETIDIVVAKSWDDNGYGVDSGTAKISDISKQLHYNVKVTLSGDNITIPNTYTNEKIIDKTDKNGIRFASLPKYVDVDTFAVYKVDESATTEPASYGQISNAYKDEGDDITDKFTYGDKHYNYGGNCKLKTEKNGSMQFNILDTLPLTSVVVQKHWDDQNNQFNLRPNNINDKNKGENTADRINLTLAKKISTAENWADLKPTKIEGTNAHEADFKDWYKSESSIPSSGNEWTYTYKKLLKYDIDNNAYTFQITEDKVKAYKEPHYCAVTDYDNESKKTEKQIVDDVDINNSQSNVATEQLAWDGTNPLVETFEITNKLDTINVIVAKKWEDNSYPNDNNLHYNVKVTLSSEDVTIPSTYTSSKVIASAVNDEYGVEFANVPRYKKDGITSVVYKVTEDATNDTATPANQQTGEKGQIATAYHDAGTATTDKFTVGSKRYGYVGSCKLEDTNSDGVMQFNILNTLPLTAVKVEKEWDDQNNAFSLRPADIADKLSIYHSSTSATSDLGSSALGSQTWGSALVAGNDYIAAEPSKPSVNKWTYTYTKLLKYDEENKPYLFKVTETKINAYKEPEYPTQYLDYSNVDATNTLTIGTATTALIQPLQVKNILDTKKVTVYKNWVDKGYTDTNTLHYDITVGLAASYGKYVENVIQSSNYSDSGTITANQSSCEFANLPVYDANGTAISYSATETGQQYGYESSISGGVTLTGGDGSITITNTLPLVSFTAQKEWDDEYNRDRARPTSVTFKLQRRINDTDSWTDVASNEAKESNNWKVDFGKQLKFDNSNNQYSYHIVEVTPAKYSSSHAIGNPTARTDDSSIMNTDYTFTNEHDITEQQLTVKKIWNDVGYKDTIRPDDLSKIKVELWCRYMNNNGTTFTDHKVSEDTTAVIGIKTHIDTKQSNYECKPGLNNFTAVPDNAETQNYNESDYESTYTFTNLPVYINVDGTATTPGDVQKWQAVTYYVKETFEVNGHVYKSEYSADGSSYYETASGYKDVNQNLNITGTTLLTSDSPADKMIYVKNTPVTRDFLVTKEWDDNGYGVTDSNSNDKVSDLSKKLHYTTAVTLKGTTKFNETETTVYNDNTKYIAAEAFASNTPHGVVFKNVPIYDKNGNVIVYKVTESKTTNEVSTGADIADVGSWNGYTTLAADSTEFEQLKADTNQRDYGYNGSAIKFTKTDVENKPYVSRYHITDELPLTAVKVEKHWLDQNNEFGLRPSGINDKNRLENESDSIDLTISRKISTDNGDYTQIYPNDTANHNEDWYKSTKSTPTDSNEWTYTYNKLLKYDAYNTAYNFKITEAPVNAYETCKYCVADVYDELTYTDKQTVTSVEMLSGSNGSWNGETVLSQNFDITNKLDTIEVIVAKKWQDNDCENGNDLHYNIKITLDSTNITMPSTYDNVKVIENTDKNGVKFVNLPRYLKNGTTVVVYKVTEDVAVSADGEDEQLSNAYHDADTNAGDLFKCNTYRYGYKGSCTLETNSTTGDMQFNILNTLPVTKIGVTKQWTYNALMYNDSLNKYRNSDISLTLQQKNESGTFVDFRTKDVAYSDSMSAEFDKLPVYNSNNAEYDYKVVENPLAGYNATYSQNNGIVTAAENNTQSVEVTNTQITGGAEVIKVDKTHYDAYVNHSNGLYSDIVISGAKFALTCNGTPVNVKQDTDGSYILDTNGNNTVVSGDDGRIVFKNFPLNTYTLTETEAPRGFLPSGTPAVFTIDVENASSESADKVTYDSGFIQGNSEVKNRIGNLQHVEETQITLVKEDATDPKIQLPNATYYLLQMKVYEYHHEEGVSESDYISAADDALRECKGVLTEDVKKYWQTSDEVNGEHLSYIYTTDSNGIIGPITGIMDGRYAFVEVQAPEGYEWSYC